MGAPPLSPLTAGGSPYYPMAGAPPPHAVYPQVGPMAGGLDTQYWFHLMHSQNGFWGPPGPPRAYGSPQTMGLPRGTPYPPGGLRYVYGAPGALSLEAPGGPQENPFCASLEELSAAAPRFYED
ncbi:formin-like protein 12 [Cyclospora cayetanensis]|uniref:Uncharacterized protein n=2 Tax=Cyclospora cayetanensis TaxID=88456 RepID=A0A1D3CVJ1_9EIME|nr:formin-like protein 12 [Cyclospora cayetanensis]OEH75225.1 hypothetical protein cyc_03315 [Cyclospora cayetanensis]